MKRRAFLTAILAGALFAPAAFAQDFVGSVIAQLRAQGFRSVVQERTLLGRVRILASRTDGKREIIINPRTGEILRDLWTPLDGSPGKVTIIDDKSGKSGKGSDDDDDDDDADDDNSGHGGGDSGGGDSGGGDSGGDDGDDDDDDED
jgi:uncharacterized membrane protein YgcG